ncbi:hypothetical protein Verru16b_00810 [Lacunisphaera limnophila]|uniref:TM7S3/TM198-like domain-containing protein n=1 Tax=Lacunisphaera limnophila TaxID=1838286 RepID=A0A1D8AS80_9BACT|nr:DUF4203 domain-containing protein [Lacunisphaera limnophila]AOS43755.1 hypothetical protein Verru16b_00810 [Lacunisphaera limnophila]
MTDLTAHYPWISAGAIAWGLLDVFFGYRVFKVTLAVVGGLIGLGGAHVLATFLAVTPGVATALLVVGAMLGAALAFLLYLAAVFVAGFGFGATLALLLLARQPPVVALVAGIVLGILGGFLAVKVQRILIVLSTSLLGSFRALLALTYFTAQIDWLFYVRQPEQLPALLDGHSWIMPATLALATVGAVAQLGLGGDKEPKKKKAE